MSNLYTALAIWMGINVAFPIVMLARHRRPHMVKRMFHWVVEANGSARRPYAHALILAAHRHR
jgi:hypothetical protein